MAFLFIHSYFFPFTNKIISSEENRVWALESDDLSSKAGPVICIWP